MQLTASCFFFLGAVTQRAVHEFEQEQGTDRSSRCLRRYPRGLQNHSHSHQLLLPLVTG